MKNEPRLLGRYLPGVLIPPTLLLWTMVAASSNSSGHSSALDGRYHSKGEVLLKDGGSLPLSHSLVLEKNRFQSLTRSSSVTIETTGRVERGAFGRIRLLLDERHVSGLSAEPGTDDELMFNLLYGRHRGAQVTLKHVGSCLYGIETRKTYCRDDHQ